MYRGGASLDIITLQQQLELIQQNDYTQMHNIDLNELSIHMLQHIGTTNGYVREELIYNCLSHFILNELLPQAQLEKLLTTCLDENYLFCEISSPNTDGVFTRSFTTLLIALILQFDTSHSFLSVEKLQEIKEKLIDYTNRESDYRGYVKDKGWAHSIAHVSDAFNEMIHNPKIPLEWYEEIVHCILNKIFIYSTVYHTNEDERIVTPLITMLCRGLPKGRLCYIICTKMKRLPNFKKRLALYEYCKLCANVKTFLRTLFFRTKSDPTLSSVATQTAKMLNELPKYY